MTVLDGEDAPRRLRLGDVAAQAGVSPATVSLVLRGIPGPSAATQQHVLAVAAQLGYRPDRAASLLASHRSRSVGVLLTISNQFHAELAEDVYASAERHRYDVVLSAVTRHRNEARAAETLLDSRCEGLVLLGPEAPQRQLSALAAQLPVVVVGRPVRFAGVDVARAADDAGVAASVAYLATLGHRDITYVDGGRGAIAALRRRGYRTAMRAHQLLPHSQIIAGGQTETAGAHAATVLLKARPLPTAVLAFNDRCALGLIDTLARAGVDIPGELSVAGYDDSPIARFAHIDLTTVSQNPAELAEHAIAALRERLENGRTQDREVVVVPHLVVRGTTAPPGLAG